MITENFKLRFKRIKYWKYNIFFGKNYLKFNKWVDKLIKD